MWLPARRLDALRAIEVLDTERDAFQWPGVAPRKAFVGNGRLGERLIRRLDDVAVERAGGLDRGDLGLGEVDGGEVLGDKAISGFGEGQGRQVGQALDFLYPLMVRRPKAVSNHEGSRGSIVGPPRDETRVALLTMRLRKHQAGDQSMTFGTMKK